MAPWGGPPGGHTPQPMFTSQTLSLHLKFLND